MYEKKYLDELREAFEAWQKEHRDEFARERKPEFVTESEILIKRLYTPLDLAEKGFDYLKDLGFPAHYPYTRGIAPAGYRGKLWNIVSYSGKPLPEESNQLWKAQIAAGASQVSVAYDLPCQLGMDPDHPKAEGEVGRVGLSAISQKDWETAFDGIDLRQINVYQVLNAPSIVGLANHIILAEKRGMTLAEIRGGQQNDILKEYMARGNYIFSPEHSMRLTGDVLSYVGEHMPNYQAISVGGVHLSERGANDIHEVALSLACGIAFLQAAVNRGIDVDKLAPSLMFLVAGDHNVFFEEIAKLRAQRRMWAKIVKERFKAKKPESLQCRFYAAEGGMGLHREQYLNNIGRITLAALASALSGCQIIGTANYDEQFGIPTTEAQVNSVLVQNVVAHEIGVDATIDPLAGSYFVESLTLETEERVWKVLEEIDKRGGIIPCIQSGYAQRLIAMDAYNWQKRFESGDLKRVGVNLLRSAAGEEAKPVRIYRANPAVEQNRREAAARLKKERDNIRVRNAIAEIGATARLAPTAQNNLVPAVIEAARAYATIGEICDALREVWGEYREPSIF